MRASAKCGPREVFMPGLLDPFDPISPYHPNNPLNPSNPNGYYSPLSPYNPGNARRSQEKAKEEAPSSPIGKQEFPQVWSDKPLTTLQPRQEVFVTPELGGMV